MLIFKSHNCMRRSRDSWHQFSVSKKVFLFIFTDSSVFQRMSEKIINYLVPKVLKWAWLSWQWMDISDTTRLLRYISIQFSISGRHFESRFRYFNCMQRPCDSTEIKSTNVQSYRRNPPKSSRKRQFSRIRHN